MPTFKGTLMQKLDLTIADHGGGKIVSREELVGVKTPAPENRWCPIPHASLVDEVVKTIERGGLHVTWENHLLAREGARYFGLLQVEGKNEEGRDYGMVVGLRNSHDRSIVAGLAMGSHVFACSNLAFSSEIVIARKHTRFIGRDLPGLVEGAVGRLADARHRQTVRIDAYKRTELSDAQVHDLVIRALDARVLPVTRIPEVLHEWRAPSYPEFVAAGKTAWRFMNGVTEALKGSNLFARPAATQALHGILDTACNVLN